MNLCSNHNILIWEVEHEKDSYSFYVSAKAMKDMKALRKKTGTKITILDKRGLPFFFHRYKKRKCFAIGALLCCILIYVMSLFIWDINVEGSVNYTNEEIRKYVEEQFVPLGKLKSQVNCADMEVALRQYFDDIAWISCEIKGTQLNITLKETIEAEDIKEDSPPMDIVASKDAVITSMITRNGTPVARQGDTVKQGDILISGTIYIYDDNQEVLETNYICADGDIYGESEEPYEESFELAYYEKEYTENEKKSYGFTFFNKQYTLNKPSVDYMYYDEVTTVHKLKLGNTFFLPISIEITAYKEYNLVRKVYTPEEAKAKAESNLNRYFESLREKGIEILENNVTITVDENSCKASGTIKTVEKIGGSRLLIIPETVPETQEDGG